MLGLLSVAVIIGVALYPREVAAEAVKRVVRVWNIDTFEGGKGSRTSFLKKTARKIAKRDKNVYYLISSMTVEGAEDAMQSGQIPDILSYGVGFDFDVGRALPLSYQFSGGQTEAGCLAVPWCRGEYALYSLTDDFTSAGNTVISCGGSNLPQVSAALADIQGEEVDSLTAYVGFLNGDYRYLLGTQRDACRFESRGAQVYKKILPAYSDLFQYVSVLSAEKREDCFLFLEELFSRETQEELSSIGMYAVQGEKSAERTVSAFSSRSALDELKKIARKKEDKENILKFLKNV